MRTEISAFCFFNTFDACESCRPAAFPFLELLPIILRMHGCVRLVSSMTPWTCWHATRPRGVGGAASAQSRFVQAGRPA